MAGKISQGHQEKTSADPAFTAASRFCPIIIIKRRIYRLAAGRNPAHGYVYTTRWKLSTWKRPLGSGRSLQRPR
jgi:hypothetical protein